jgi:3-dehydroquinate dehydratase/shikimate dehydrogenase
MAHLCIAVMVDDPDLARPQLAQSREHGADLVELRLDLMTDRPDEARDLVDGCPLPCIVTCRHASEGGGFEGDESDRIALYRAVCAADAPPRYLDVELASYLRDADLRHAVNDLVDTDEANTAVRPRLILSVHDFERRPADLSKKLIAMLDEPRCTVMKIAHRARSLRDNAELFELLRTRGKPTIALGMGEFGLMSRVLASKYGGLLTFAGLSADSVTAPGQPSADELIERYRFRSIGRSSAVYGVVGWPVGHSMGPAIHNAAFEHAAYDGVYLPLPVAEGWESFKATMLTLLDGDAPILAGASVTIPHKQHLVRLAIDEGWDIDPLAKAIGAANTLTWQGDTWRISNTDAPAIAMCMREALGRPDLKDVAALVIGAGGAARAAVAALLGGGARVMLVNRSRDRAEALAADIAELGAVEVVDQSGGPAASPELIVQATSVGMQGGPDESGCPADQAWLEPRPAVVETVYNPVETPLVLRARGAGCPVVTGDAMFVQQAALQFEAWSGREAPLGVYRTVLARCLGDAAPPG